MLEKFPEDYKEDRTLALGAKGANMRLKQGTVLRNYTTGALGEF